MVCKLRKDDEFLKIPSVLATKEDTYFGKDLLDTIKFYEKTCVGMAANMIGISKNIIVIKDNKEFVLMYNPEIIDFYNEVYFTEEGCLCHEGVRPVKRYKKIKVKYYDKNFSLRIKTYKDFTAQIIQHEIDHLKGVLI